MRKWLRQRLSGADHSSELGRRLVDYPPFELPHPGPRLELTSPQLSTNLTHFLSVRDERIQLIRALSAADGVSWPDALDQADPRSFIEDLHEWAGRTWPAIAPGDVQAYRAAVFDGARAGEHIGASMTADVALVIGELVRLARPSLDWGVDDDDQNRTDGMAHWHRIVLAGRWIPDPTVPVALDIELLTLDRLIQPNSTNNRFLNEWLWFYDGAVRGGYEGEGLVGGTSEVD